MILSINIAQQTKRMMMEQEITSKRTNHWKQIDLKLSFTKTIKYSIGKKSQHNNTNRSVIVKDGNQTL
jgi:hypothetical protein